MSGLRYAASDTLVLAKRSLLRIPRAPDLLLSFTVQPIMFVLLFAYVFGGALWMIAGNNMTSDVWALRREHVPAG